MKLKVLTFTRARRRFGTMLVLALSILAAVMAAPATAAPIVVVDTLDASTDIPDLLYCCTMGGGYRAFQLGSDIPGVQFTLAEPTTIVEIATVIGLDSRAPRPLYPYLVEVRPSVDGKPDLSTSLGRFALSPLLLPPLASAFWFSRVSAALDLRL